MEIEEDSDLKMLKCRLCNKCLKPNESQYIFLKNTNEITALGQKLMAVLNIEVEELSNFSHVCCNVCSYKAQHCFSLLMDLHSANAVMQKIHKESINSERSIHTMTDTALLDCDKCDDVSNDMNSFTRHYEIHVLLEIADLCSENVKQLKSKDILDTIEFESFKTNPEDVVIIVNDRPTKEVQTVGDVEKYEVAEEIPLETTSNSLDIKKTGKRKFECDICNKKLSRKYILENHIKKWHLTPGKKKKTEKDKVSICKICFKVIPKGQFKRHSIACQSEFLTQGALLCYFCGKTVQAQNWSSHLYKHQEQRKGSRTCSICQKSFSTPKGLAYHMYLHDESKHVICDICGLNVNPHVMWKHKKYHKGKEFTCDVCGKAFIFNYLMRAHRKTHESTVVKIGARSKAHKCPKCGEKFPFMSNLNIHLRDVHDDLSGMKNNVIVGKVHKCPKCEKEYSFLSMLNTHIREEHNDPGLDVKSNFPCEECDKTFDDKFSLRNHFLLMHDAAKEDVADLSKGNRLLGVFHCTECDKVLQSDSGLRKHLRLEHNLKSNEMPALMRRKCEKCDKTFTDKQGLYVHIKAAHLNVQNIRCNICNKTFKRYQSLVNHKLQHTGAKPFECEVCSKTFRQRVDTMRHLQRHVRNGEATLDEAVARNNSESSKLRKNRIFLKDSKWVSSSEIWENTSSKKPKIEMPEIVTIYELE